MENFIYKNPTTVYFGKKMEEKIGEIVAEYSKNILLHHYGADVLKMIGIYDTIIKSLNDAGVRFTELGGVKPNPRISLVREGIEICRKEGIDFILAVGGGSVIDSAKAISFGVPYDGDVWDFFTKKAKVQKTLSIGSVLTIAGTGSETSSSCVVTNEETLVKGGVGGDFNRPKFTVMNPELSMSLPEYQTACGTYDALTHIIERYFTAIPNVVTTDLLCEALMKAIIHVGPLQLDDPKNYDYRAEIMWASKVAHDNSLGVGRVVDYSAHILGQQIGAVCDIAHGVTLAIMLPAWMRYVYKDHLDRFCKFAVNVFDVELGTMSPELTALEGIIRLENFIKRMGLPIKLSEIDIDSSMIPGITDAFKERTIGTFHPLNKDDIDKIFELAK